MPEAGVPARARHRDATPWWEELDRDAFRFPTAYEVKPTPVRAAVVAVPDPDPVPVRATVAAVPALAGPADDGRRTVTIRGRGAERNLPVTRPTLRRHERPGFRPDRAALWAVLLGLLLILVAAASAHAAIPH